MQKKWLLPVDLLTVTCINEVKAWLSKLLHIQRETKQSLSINKKYSSNNI